MNYRYPFIATMDFSTEAHE